MSFGNGRGVCFCSLALTRRLLNDRFFLRAIRGVSGNRWFSIGSFLTSSQICLRVFLTSGMCPLYVRDKNGVLGGGFVCSFFFLYMILCLSLKCICLISGLTMFSLYPLTRSACSSLWVCSLKFASSVLVLRNLYVSPRVMLLTTPFGWKEEPWT